jgi:hypothetical protein
MKRQGSATRSRIDRDGVRVRRNGPIAFGKKPRSAKRRSETRKREEGWGTPPRGSPRAVVWGILAAVCRRQSRGIVPPADSPVPAARVRRAPETARARAGSDKPSAKRSEPSEKQRAWIRRRRGAFARPRERAITRRRSIDDRSIDGIGASRGASEPRSREKAVLQNEHRLVVRGRRARGAGGETHLLPWGCHTIMELVLAALPVETTGALLRTGATAERAAILSCG